MLDKEKTAVLKIPVTVRRTAVFAARLGNKTGLPSRRVRPGYRSFLSRILYGLSLHATGLPLALDAHPGEQSGWQGELILQKPPVPAENALYRWLVDTTILNNINQLRQKFQFWLNQTVIPQFVSRISVRFGSRQAATAAAPFSAGIGAVSTETEFVRQRLESTRSQIYREFRKSDFPAGSSAQTSGKQYSVPAAPIFYAPVFPSSEMGKPGQAAPKAGDGSIPPFPFQRLQGLNIFSAIEFTYLRPLVSQRGVAEADKRTETLPGENPVHRKSLSAPVSSVLSSPESHHMPAGQWGNAPETFVFVAKPGRFAESRENSAAAGSSLPGLVVNKKLVGSVLRNTEESGESRAEPVVTEFTFLRKERQAQPLSGELVFTRPIRRTMSGGGDISLIQEKKVVKIVRQEVQDLMASSSSPMRFNRSDYNKIADEVYNTLTRRLIVEKEQRGLTI